MAVRIKDLDINMELGNNGVEFEVRSTDNSKQIGDLYVTKTGLIWCKGRKRRENGISKSWDDVVQMFKDNAWLEWRYEL